MNKEMEKRLKSYVGKDILISLYSDTDEPESFTLGYLLEMDESNVLVNMVDSFGEENGFCTIILSDIFIFDQDKMYSEKMNNLFKLKNQSRKYIVNLKSNPIISFLENALENKILVEVNEDDNYVGYVIEFSIEFLELAIIDNYGNDMGMAIIDMGHVGILKCQNRYLKDLELLYGGKQ